MKKITSILALFLMCFGMAVQAGPTDLPQLTEDLQNPKLYTIKNVRKSKFVTYAGDNQAMKLVAENEVSSKSLFYFTGTIDDATKVATVKIHNYGVSGKKCLETNSWNADGRDWYIASKKTTGLSISKTQKFDGNNSWNDFEGKGVSIAYYNATDDGSIWEIIPFNTAVATANQFSNRFVYTVQSPRGWMMSKEGCPNVVSTKKYPTLTTGADVAACQWAIYKSARGNFYMYNLGAKKFMGFSSTNNASIPFVDSPASDKLKFKASTNADKKAEYPLMPYYEGVTALNHTDVFGDGLISWIGGANDTNDEGNIHKFTFVGELSAEDYQLITSKVTAYEEKFEIETLKNSYKAIQGYVGGLTVKETEALLALTSLADIKSYINTHPVIQVESGKYYRIKSIVRMLNPQGGNSNWDRPGHGGYIGTTPYKSNQTELTCGTEQLNDAGTIWQFEKNGDGYKFKNLNNGKYIGHNQNMINGGVAMFENVADAGTYKLVAIGNAQYKLDVNGQKLHVSTGKFMYYDSNDPASKWYIIPATELEVDMNTAADASWSSLYLPFDVTLPTELEAYTGKLNGNSLSMTKVTEVPANNGVILKGKAAKYTLNIAEAKPLTGENSLKGTNVKMNNIVQAQYYILGNGTAGVGLYHPNATSLKANKAFVEATAAAQVLKFDFNGETTGVEGVEVESETANAAYYDLSGRRVANPAKGVYIKNGKKVYVK